MEHLESTLTIPGTRVRTFVCGACRYAVVDYSTNANKYLTVLRLELTYPDWEERGLRDVEPSEIPQLTDHLSESRIQDVLSVKEVTRAGEGLRKHFVCWQVTRFDAVRRDVITTQEDRGVGYALHKTAFLFQTP